MARPRKILDLAKIEALAAISCPADEIAAELDVARTTIQNRRFDAAVKKGHLKGKRRVRSILFKQALDGNTAAAIFLAKAFCGMREQPDTIINVSASATGGQLVISDEGKKQLEDLAASIQQRVYQRVRNPVTPSGNGNGTTALN